MSIYPPAEQRRHSGEAIRRAVAEWVRVGAAVLPVRLDGTKAPALPHGVPEALHERPNTPDELALFSAEQAPALGVMMGHLYGAGPDGALNASIVIGHVETFEFEGRAVAEGVFDRWCEAMRQAGHESLLDRLLGGLLVRSPSGGLHLTYQLDTWGLDLTPPDDRGRRRYDGVRLGSVKVARRPLTDEERVDKIAASVAAGRDEEAARRAAEASTECLIEIRGIGAYVVTAPSGGQAHRTGNAWVAHEGRGPSGMAMITLDERAAIIRVGAEFDIPLPANSGDASYRRARRFELDRAQGAPAGEVLARWTPPEWHGLGPRPSDVYCERMSVADVLDGEGWTALSGGKMFHRDGSQNMVGASVVEAESGRELVYFWSDGDARFEQSTDGGDLRPYSAFEVFAIVRHEGDWVEAAKAVRALWPEAFPATEAHADPVEARSTPAVFTNGTEVTEPLDEPLKAVSVDDPVDAPREAAVIPLRVVHGPALTDGALALDMAPPASAAEAMERYGKPLSFRPVTMAAWCYGKLARGIRVEKTTGATGKPRYLRLTRTGWQFANDSVFDPVLLRLVGEFIAEAETALRRQPLSPDEWKAAAKAREYARLRYAEVTELRKVLHGISTIDDAVVSIEDVDPEGFIAFTNGVLDVRSTPMRFEPWTADAPICLRNVGYAYRPVEADDVERVEESMRQLFVRPPVAGRAIEADEEVLTAIKMAVACATLGHHVSQSLWFHGCEDETATVLVQRGRSANGSNGKSFLADALRQAFGGTSKDGYAVKPDNELVAPKRFSNYNPTASKARLEGARLVTFDDVDSPLDPKMLKELVGSPTISARPLYEAERDFAARYVVFGTTNGVQVPGALDNAIERRLIFLPCRRVFVDAVEYEELAEEYGEALSPLFLRIDMSLLNDIAADPMIMMSWMLAQVPAWRARLADGARELPVPRVAREAIREIAIESDRVQEFVTECLVHTPGASIKHAGNDSTSLFAAFTRWADRNERSAMTSLLFSKRLRKCFIDSVDGKRTPLARFVDESSKTLRWNDLAVTDEWATSNTVFGGMKPITPAAPPAQSPFDGFEVGGTAQVLA